MVCHQDVKRMLCDKIEKDDISWFPIGKSLSLLEISDGEEGKD